MSYRKVFNNPYPEGWVDLPNEDTSISAAALQAHTDAIEKMDSYLEKIGKAEDAGYIQMNMFNMSTVYIGKKLGDEGELVDDPGSMTTDFIEIDDKLQYMLSALNDSECLVKVHAYNSDFEWMMLCAMQTFYENVVFPFAVVNGAKYIKVSLSKDAKEVVLEDGYITHPYLPSNKELAAELSEQKESLIQYEQSGFLSRNLYDESKKTNGIFTDNGDFNASTSGSYASDYIEVSEGSYVLSFTRNDAEVYTRIIGFKANKEKATNPLLKKDTDVTLGKKVNMFTVPSEVKYIRFNYSNKSTEVQLEKGTEATQYVPYAMSNQGLTQIVDSAIDGEYISRNFLQTSLEEIKSANKSGTWNGNTYTLNGITFTVNDDLSIKINGTSTAITYFDLVVGGTFDTTKYVGKIFRLGYSLAQYYDVTGKISPSNRADTQIFNRNNDTVIANNGSGLYLALRVGNNANIPNLVISPMIRSASDSNTDYDKPVLTTSSIKQSLAQLVADSTPQNLSLTTESNVKQTYRLRAKKIGKEIVLNIYGTLNAITSDLTSWKPLFQMPQGMATSNHIDFALALGGAPYMVQAMVSNTGTIQFMPKQSLNEGTLFFINLVYVLD